MNDNFGNKSDNLNSFKLLKQNIVNRLNNYETSIEEDEALLKT